MSKPRVALFVVDGVLARGFTILNFARTLHREGLIDSSHWLSLYGDFKALQAGRVSYAQFASDSVDHWGLALSGRDREKIDEAGGRFCLMEKRLYWYARPLVSLFRERGIRTVAITGSTEECLAPMVHLLGLNEAHGTSLETDESGRYTGRVLRNMALRSSKETVASEMSTRFDLARSFAFGASDQDITMLEMAGGPVAVNPRPGLARLATERGWPVVTHRHDVPMRVAGLLDGRRSAQFDG